MIVFLAVAVIVWVLVATHELGWWRGSWGRGDE
jgi:hypothetical protein